jgi:DNA-directed RNA polymerase specialized sigma24 family protein
METYELFHRCAGRSPERPGRPDPETDITLDPRAWELLVEHHGADIERGVRRALARSRRQARRELIEDLVQETWCRLLDGGGRRLAAFRGRERQPAAVWLEKVAYRSTVDLLRKGAALKRGGRGVRRRHLASRTPPCPHRLPSPFTRLVLADWSRQVAETCRQRDPSGFAGVVVHLTVRRGWSSVEISRWSARHGRPMRSSSVNSLISRCRWRLERSGVPVPPRERPTGSSRRRRGRSG